MVIKDNIPSEDLKQQLAEKLKELNAQITKDDRKDYEEISGLSQGTISNYMNGTIYDIEKAIKMADFFKKRVEDRNKKIQELIN